MNGFVSFNSALYLQLPAGVIVTTLFVYGGLVLHARYPVDPVSDCTIDLPDQVNYVTVRSSGHFMRVFGTKAHVTVTSLGHFMRILGTKSIYEQLHVISNNVAF